MLTKRPVYETFLLPEWSLAYFINGDSSALTDDEKDLCDDLASERKFFIVTIPDDSPAPAFSYYNDVEGNVRDMCHKCNVVTDYITLRQFLAINYPTINRWACWARLAELCDINAIASQFGNMETYPIESQIQLIEKIAENWDAQFPRLYCVDICTPGDEEFYTYVETPVVSIDAEKDLDSAEITRRLAKIIGEQNVKFLTQDEILNALSLWESENPGYCIEGDNGLKAYFTIGFAHRIEGALRFSAEPQ